MKAFRHSIQNIIFQIFTYSLRINKTHPTGVGYSYNVIKYILYNYRETLNGATGKALSKLSVHVTCACDTDLCVWLKLLSNLNLLIY